MSLWTQMVESRYLFKKGSQYSNTTGKITKEAGFCSLVSKAQTQNPYNRAETKLGHFLLSSSFPPRSMSYKSVSSRCVTIRPVTSGMLSLASLPQSLHYMHSGKTEDRFKEQTGLIQMKMRIDRIQQLYLVRWFNKGKREMDLVSLSFSGSNLLKPEWEMNIKET